MFRKLTVITFITMITLNLVASEINEDYEKAIASYYENQFDASYIHLKNSLDKSPTHLPSKILMGKVLALSLYYSEAIVEFEEAFLAGADPNLILEFYANSLVVERKFDKIMGLSDKGLNTKNRALLNTFKANAAQALGQSGTEALFKAALEDWEDNPTILNAYARFLISENKIAAAQIKIDKALLADKEHVETLRTQALLHKINNQQTQYIATLEKTIQLDSEQPFVLRDLVTAYLGSQQIQKARELLTKLLANNQQDFMASLLLSYVDSLSGETEVSNKRLERLVNELSLVDNEIINKASGLLYINGLANFALGNDEKAKTELAKYLSYQPNNLKAAIILSDLYAETGNITGALSVLLNFNDRLKNDIELIAKVCRLYISVNSHIKCNRLLLNVDQALQSDPRVVSLQAQSLSAQGKEIQALALLDDINEVTNTSQLTKALLAIQTNQLTLAETTVAQLLKDSPSNLDYLNLKAGVLIKQGRFAESENILINILNNAPKHFEARFNLASVYFNQGRIEQATQLAQTLHAEQETQVNVLYLLASLAHVEGKFEISTGYLQTALNLQSEYKQARVLLIENYQALTRYAEALSEVNTLLRKDFLDPEFLSLRAEIYAQLNQTENKIKDLNSLFNLYKDSPTQLFSLAELQWRLGQRESAFESVERALEISSTDFYLLRMHAQYALALGIITKAKASIETLTSTFSDNADVALLNGDLSLIQGNPKLASQHYDKAININKGFEQAIYKRYNLAMRGVEEQAFVDSFKKLGTKRDSTTSINHYLADYYLSRADNTNAKKHYSLALRDTNYTNRSAILNNLSYIYQLEENYEQSIVHARDALSADPNNSATLDTLGWSLVNIGEIQKGLNLLRQSYSLNTSDPNVLYHIAFALNELGRKQEAKQALDDLVSNFENFRSRDKTIKLLEDLSS
jgi:putative PEP-CTERM system TPR-repeat lipoprotein